MSTVLRSSTHTKRIILIAVLVASVLAIGQIDSLRAKRGPVVIEPQQAPLARKDKVGKSIQYASAQEFVKPGRFINTAPFTLESLIGKKVILIDFWTYSSIESQRTVPYLNAWYQKYKDAGLVVVGVHTPEFGFEKEYENVVASVRKLGIKYPVVQDNELGTWGAYKNEYWPSVYLVDADGFIVYSHIGEGSYEDTERAIQDALQKRATVLGEETGIPTDLVTVPSENGFSPKLVGSPETYFGAAKNSLLANGIRKEVGVQALNLPAAIDRDSLYLEGNWGFRDEFAYDTKGPAKIVYKYSARDVYIVASAEVNVRVKVLLDGKPIGKRAGEDVDANGILTIKADRLYKVVHDPDGYGEHTLELLIEDPSLRVYTITFG